MIPSMTHEFVATIDVEVGEPLETGSGMLGNRRLIPILRGRVTGPRIDAVLLEGGADSQIIRPNGTIELSARYMFKTAEGAVIYVENNGIRRPFSEAELGRHDTAAPEAGTPEAPPATYFRTVPRFETAHPGYQWLADSVHVATAVRYPARVLIHVFKVL